MPVWNVVATPEFSIAPLRWCFPVAGCVSYRGYFKEREARDFAAGLAARGDDVFVAGVTAYSTLGHFFDPVVSSMLRYDDLDLVSTIFHELAHQLLYVPGDSDFSEAFATTVAEGGAAHAGCRRTAAAANSSSIRAKRAPSRRSSKCSPTGAASWRRCTASSCPPNACASASASCLRPRASSSRPSENTSTIACWARASL